jgi:cytochrome c554/c'-like protein
MKLACGFASLQRWSLLAFAVACVAGLVLRFGKGRGSATERPLAIVVSADTAGWIIPCGCTTNQSGGLARRATYIKQLAVDSDVIVADAGGAAGGDSAYDRLKFAAILSGEQAMGLAAHNLGGSELSLGANECRRLADGGAPLVSANTTDRGGKPVVAPLKIVDAGGRRIALVGVVSPHYATAEIQVAPPGQAVFSALHDVAGRYDAAIVLAYLPIEELESLAHELPEVDAVVGGPTLQSIPPHKSGPTLVTSVTNKGKFLATLRWQRPRDKSPASGSGDWNAEIFEVAEPLIDDPKQLAGVGRFEEELARRDFTPAEAGFAAIVSDSQPTDSAVAGSDTCRKCHAAESKICDASRHHGAWQSLVDKGFSGDAFCQRCHTNAYGLSGGFVSARRTPERVNVDCESCHGPASAHVKDPTNRTPFTAREQCTRCHDRENSPQFVYDTYWPRIEHGSPAKKPGTEIAP